MIEQARRSDRLMTACRCATAARLAAGPTIFLKELAKGGRIEHLLGEKLLQLRVLLFQGPQPLRLGNVHAGEFGLPIVDRCLGYPMLASQVGRLHPSLMQSRMKR
jgi:hypothetical protein